ncbi:hypothetical protein CKO27_19010 [Thiocystis violacea]|nr:hypothetical protein [Thiocystis violacea]
MKLAEALILRADCLRRIRELKSRLAASAKIQEGDEPFEDPQTLIRELEQVATEFLGLIQRINRTNVQTPFEDGKTLADALAERDIIKLRRGIYSDLQDKSAGGEFFQRVSRAEIKFIFTIDVAENNRKIDALSKVYRELDTRIQQLNWTVDLVD